MCAASRVTTVVSRVSMLFLMTMRYSKARHNWKFSDTEVCTRRFGSFLTNDRTTVPTTFIKQCPWLLEQEAHLDILNVRCLIGDNSGAFLQHLYPSLFKVRKLYRPVTRLAVGEGPRSKLEHLSILRYEAWGTQHDKNMWTEVFPSKKKICSTRMWIFHIT